MDTNITMSSENNNQTEELWRQGFLLFARCSAWIVGPVLIGWLIGQWADAKYNWTPWGTVAAIGFMFIISMVGLIREAGRAYKKALSAAGEKSDAKNSRERGQASSNNQSDG